MPGQARAPFPSNSPTSNPIVAYNNPGINPALGGPYDPQHAIDQVFQNDIYAQNGPDTAQYQSGPVDANRRPIFSNNIVAINTAPPEPEDPGIPYSPPDYFQEYWSTQTSPMAGSGVTSQPAASQPVASQPLNSYGQPMYSGIVNPNAPYAGLIPTSGPTIEQQTQINAHPETASLFGLPTPAASGPSIGTTVIPGYSSGSGGTSSRTPAASQNVYGQVLGSGSVTPGLTNAVQDPYSALFYDGSGLQSYQGTPLYQQTGQGVNFGSNFAAQQSYDKIQYWNSLSPMEKAQLQASNPSLMPTGQDAANVNQGIAQLWNGGLADEYRQMLNQLAIQQGQAYQQIGVSGQGFAPQIQYGVQLENQGLGGYFNNTFNGVGTGRTGGYGDGGGVGFADGNQNANYLNAVQNLGINVSPELMSLANTQDLFWDSYNPYGILPPLLALGSKEGLGGVGSGALSQVAETPYVDPKFVTYNPGRGNYNGPTSNAPTSLPPAPQPGIVTDVQGKIIPPGTNPPATDPKPPVEGNPGWQNQYVPPGYIPPQYDNSDPYGKLVGNAQGGQPVFSDGNGGFFSPDPQTGKNIPMMDNGYGQFIQNPLYIPSTQFSQPAMPYTAGSAGGASGGVNTAYPLATPDVFTMQEPMLTPKTNVSGVNSNGIPFPATMPQSMSGTSGAASTGFLQGVMDAVFGQHGF